MYQKGFAHLLLILILLAGLVAGLYLVGKQTVFKPKASVGDTENSLSLVGFVSGEEPIHPQDNPTVSTTPDSSVTVHLLTRVSPDEVNLISSELSYPKDLLEVVSILKNTTDPYIIKNWVEEYQNEDEGTIKLVGGIPNPGYKSASGQTGRVATIIFKAKPNTQGKTGRIELLEASTQMYKNSDNTIIPQVIKRSLEVRIVSTLTQTSPSPVPSIQPSSSSLTKKVLLVIYDPLLANGQKLHQTKRWFDPKTIANQLTITFRQVTGGYLNYQIAETVERNEWPQLRGGLSASEAETRFDRCIDAIYSRAPVAEIEAKCNPLKNPLTYAMVWSDFDICRKVSSGQIDEVWIASFPYAGDFDEFAFKIPGDRVPYNTPRNNWMYQWRTHGIPDCNNKTVLVMGWNYERGLAEALESYGHRIESVLGVTVSRGDWQADCGKQAGVASDFDKFTCLAKDVAGSPSGIVGCGNAHSAYNGDGGYSRDVTTTTQTACSSWQNYPFTTPTLTTGNCTEWGCTGDSYLKWWMSNIPRKAGKNSSGNLNNWWKYIVDFDNAVVEAKGGASAPVISPSPSPSPIATARPSASPVAASPSPSSCPQVITPGLDPQSLHCQDYPTPCAVPPDRRVLRGAASCQTAGDINSDSRTNLADLSALFSKAGMTANLGRADINGDGTVNAADFSLLRIILISRGIIRGN